MVAEYQHLKETIVGVGKRRRPPVLSFNPHAAERQRKHREQVLKEIEAELESVRHSAGEPHAKRPCQLRSSGRYGSHIRFARPKRLPSTRRSMPRKADDNCLHDPRWLCDRRDLKGARQNLAGWLKRWEGRHPKLTDWVEDQKPEALREVAWLTNLSHAPLFAQLDGNNQLGLTAHRNSIKICRFKASRCRISLWGGNLNTRKCLLRLSTDAAFGA